MDLRIWQNRLVDKAIAAKSKVPVVIETSRSLPRAVAQQSVVTLVPDPASSFPTDAYLFSEMSVKVPIPAGWRRLRMSSLNSMGITRSSLFMDLDSTGAALSRSLGF